MEFSFGGLLLALSGALFLLFMLRVAGMFMEESFMEKKFSFNNKQNSILL